MTVAPMCLTPLRDFVSTHSGARLEQFMQIVVGPFLVFRMSGDSPKLLDLGLELKNGHQQIVLGRKKGAHLRFPDTNISGHHARVIFHQNQWILEDLGSTNGTFASDQQLPAHSGAVLQEGRAYALADIVEIEFFSTERFFKEIDSRARNPKDSRRISNRRYAMMRRTTKRQLRLRQGVPVSLKTFATKHKGLDVAEFSRLYPCPFLILLTSSQPKPKSNQDRTLFAEQIIVQRGMENLHFWPLASKNGSSEIILGRSDNSDLVLNHQTISKAHALFAHDELLGEWTIEDLSSRNGVLLDGNPIQNAAPLADEVCLRFGTEVLTQFIKTESFFRFMQLYTLSHNLS